MLNRINELLDDNESFAFETTLASRSYRNKIVQAQNQGYSVTLLFFWLNNVNLAIERVKTRVKEGGHSIPRTVIERRYTKGVYNLFDIYLPIVDGALIFDNSYGKHELIAHKMSNDNFEIINGEKFKHLKKYYEKK